MVGGSSFFGVPAGCGEDTLVSLSATSAFEAFVKRVAHAALASNICGHPTSKNSAAAAMVAHSLVVMRQCRGCGILEIVPVQSK